jgi:DNA replication protein
MSEFQGFPGKMLFTPVPNLVFSALLPEISDIAELKLLLHIFEIIYPKKGNLKFTTLAEILNHPAVAADFKQGREQLLPALLSSLTGRNILLHLSLREDQESQEVYFLNSRANREALAKIQSGEYKLAGLPAPLPAPLAPPGAGDIFSLYEQNIGLLTPLIADALRDAENEYPENWIKEAIQEAVINNKRNWRYIARILERWAAEGKGSGTHRGNLKTNTDPDKFIRGKYGHMVQR